MRHRHLVWFVGVCVAWAGWSATGSGQASPAEKAVMQAIDQINTAFQHRDVKAYEGLTTGDFVRIASNGRVFGRSEWLKNVAAPGPERGPGKFDQLSVRVYGDGAIVTYRNTPAGAGGQPGAVNYLTRVMAREGTQWKMALAQSTDTQPPAAPTGAEPAALPAWSASTAADRDALATFKAIQKANADRNLAAWERLSAADHTIISAEGTRTSRAERVAALKAPAAAPAAAPATDQSVRVMVKGDVAAVTWTTNSTRSLKVLARKGGTWQQVLQQATPVVTAKK
ncbi:MAG: nuclear transport factor 2 family protein [Vicinamibacterales bacterium]